MSLTREEWGRVATTLLAAAGLALAFGAAWRLHRQNEPPAREPSPAPTATGSEVRPAYLELTPLTLPFEQATCVAASPGGLLYAGGDAEVLALRGGKITGRLQLDETPTCLGAYRESLLAVGTRASVTLFDIKETNAATETGTGTTIFEIFTQWKLAGEKTLLTSLAVDAERVYAADAGNRVVLVFDRGGKLLAEIGRRDEKRGMPGFVVPSPYFDLAPTADGRLRVTNPGAHRVEIYTLGGELLSYWGKASGADLAGFTGCCNPSHLAVLPYGGTVTAEKGTPRIKVYDADGNFAQLVAGPESFDSGTVGLDLAADATGKIYALDPRRKQVRTFVNETEGKQ